MQKNHLQSGRSMIEMLAVIMIIGIISIGALAGFNQGMSKYRVGKMNTEIQAINSDTLGLFSWQRSYPDSTTITNFQQLLCSNGVFPSGCKENVAYNPFGGTYTVSTNKANQTMTITATLIPTESCEDLIIQDWQYITDEPTCSNSSPATFTITFE